MKTPVLSPAWLSLQARLGDSWRDYTSGRLQALTVSAPRSWRHVTASCRLSFNTSTTWARVRREYWCFGRRPSWFLCQRSRHHQASMTTDQWPSHLMKVLERLVLAHLRPQVRALQDPLQYAYQPHCLLVYWLSDRQATVCPYGSVSCLMWWLVIQELLSGLYWTFPVHLIHHWLSVQHRMVSPAEVFLLGV